jgi:two-component system response regulator
MSSIKKILVVDDDPEDRSIVEDGFAEVGFDASVQYEEDGEQALRFLRAAADNGHLPCLIILDLNMPRMNGTQTLRTIKEDPRLRNISVLIYSTSFNPIEKEECIELGARDFVIKPVTYAESLKTIHYFKSLCEELNQVVSQ